MKILIADCAGHGIGDVLKRILGLKRPDIEVKVVESILKLEETIRSLEPGDILIGQLVEMQAGGIFDAGSAVNFLEKLEGEWLAKGARAILLDSLDFGQSKRIKETIELCLGRIVLVDSPIPTRNLLTLLDRWKIPQPEGES